MTARNTRILAFFAFVLFFIPFINAETTGCCYDASTGTCAHQSTRDQCTQDSGTFLSCSDSRCSVGCCILGNNGLFPVTQATCELSTRQYGFSSINFLAGSDTSIGQACEQASLGDTTGACVAGDIPPYDCRLTPASQCVSGNFYPDMECTNPQLQTDCKDTGKYTCYDGDVYTLTSCGPGDLVDDCDYASGTKCGKNEEGDYICKSLDCREDLKNGESECVFDKDLGRPIYRELLLNRAADYPFSNGVPINSGGQILGTLPFVDLGAEWWSGESCVDSCRRWGYGDGAIGGDLTFEVRTHCYCFSGNILDPDPFPFSFRERVLVHTFSSGSMQESSDSCGGLALNSYGLAAAEQTPGNLQCSAENYCNSGFVSIGKTNDCNRCCINTTKISCGQIGPLFDFRNSDPANRDLEVHNTCPNDWINLGISSDLNSSGGNLKCCAKPSCGKLGSLYGYTTGGDLTCQSNSCTNKPYLRDLGKTLEPAGTCEHCCAKESYDETWPAGSEFLVGHCVDGKEIFEPCASNRNDFCRPGKEARCEKNAWLDCATYTSENFYETCRANDKCYVFQPTNYINLSEKKLVNSSLGEVHGIYNPGQSAPDPGITEVTNSRLINGARNSLLDRVGSSIFLDDFNSKLCMSKVPPGVLRSASTTTPSTAAVDVCAAGTVEADIGFSHYDAGISYDGVAPVCGDGDMDTIQGPWFCYKNCAFIDWAWQNTFISGGQVYNAITDANCIGDVCSKTDDNCNSLYAYTRSSDCSRIIDGRMNALWNDWRTHCYSVSNSSQLIDLEKIPLNLDLLNAQCKARGSCSGELVNWVDKQGAPSGNKEYAEWDGEKHAANTVTGAPGNSEILTFHFKYECKPFKAPEGDGDCSLCNTYHPIVPAENFDVIPCTQYRCESLGTKCSFMDASGICMSSDDRSAPKITLDKIDPEPPVEPWAQVAIDISTDEPAKCKFNVNYAGARFDEMRYDFGVQQYSIAGYGMNHGIILNLPGQIMPAEYNDSEVQYRPYPIIKEGKNNLYVRCVDAADNGQWSAPFQIEFEVMKKPDMIAPIILNFTPLSGSKIKFNTTSKDIRFRISEPAECRWSFEDVEYGNMQNSFSCDTSSSDTGLIKGYYCSGTLKNVTRNIDEQTKYYIRCKDQPWLEGEETNIYKRIANSRSTEYVLRPSQELQIVETSPKGTIEVGKLADAKVELVIATSGGADYGNALCTWSLGGENTQGPQVKFQTTNSAFHRQTITSPHKGENIVKVRCNDSAENVAKADWVFNIFVDKDAPFITRILGSRNSLDIKTDEKARCYLSFNKKLGCMFELFSNNTINMTLGDSKKEHSAGWNPGSTYFMRCLDSYGNDNSGCGMIARAR